MSCWKIIPLNYVAWKGLADTPFPKAIKNALVKGAAACLRSSVVDVLLSQES